LTCIILYKEELSAGSSTEIGTPRECGALLSGM